MSDEPRPPDFKDTNIREFGEEYPVDVVFEEGEYVIKAWNEGHHNNTIVSLKDVIEWACEHMPDLFDKDTRRDPP